MRNEEGVKICDYGGCFSQITGEVFVREVYDCVGRVYFFYFCSEKCKEEHMRHHSSVNFGINNTPDEQGYF